MSFSLRPARFWFLIVLLCVVQGAPIPTIQKSNTKGHIGHHGEPLWSREFWWKVLISVFLVLAGGVFSGLTLGLMGLDELHLRVLAASSEDTQESRDAKKVWSLLSRGRHWILVVLLLSNVVVNESLPIFLDSAIGGGLIAVIISTTMVVIFGEVIPQAVCVRHGLRIGAKCVPAVLALMYILSPIAWPIAKLLDWALGKGEFHTYKKAELKSLLSFHGEGAGPLVDHELTILNGVLELSTKTAEAIMTPLKDVTTISSDTILDHDTVASIMRSGYSRIPVHLPNRPLAFVGILLVKKLSVYDPSEALPVSNFPLSILPEADPSISCFQVLDYFQTGRAHLLLLSHTPGSEGGAVGVVTLEDVIEEIISKEIIDETDQYQDNQSKQVARRTKNAAVMRGIVEYRMRRNSFQLSVSPARKDINEPGNEPPTDRTPLLQYTPLPSIGENINIINQNLALPTIVQPTN